jgi:hypothetical protein
VGTKNRFVVTWLTNQNCQAGVFGKFPMAPEAADAVELPLLLLALLDELHAASRAEAAAVALEAGPGQQLAPRRAVLHVQRLYRFIDLWVDLLHADLQLSPLRGNSVGRC